MPTSQWLKVAIADRKDAQLTVERSGDLYGCQLTLFVKVQSAGDPELIPDAQGNTSTDFMVSPNARTIPASKLNGGDTAYLDVIVTVSQPAKMSGNIDFTARLEIAGQPASQTDNKIALKPGDDADVMHLGWEIDKP